LEYSLRKTTDEDFLLSYEIRKNALGKYVEETWGWDEVWQMKYHKEDFDTEILQIIEVEGKPAGTLESFEENETLRVSGLYITGEYQNKGIGENLMRKILSSASEKKLPVKLQVLKVNSRAKKFYEDLGFRVSADTEKHFQMVYEH
jgi:ribosomal protein S18 acetylase RimI-like enzyme